MHETLMKLFLNFNRKDIAICSYIGSFVSSCLSKLVEISRLIEGRALPVNKYTLSQSMCYLQASGNNIRHVSFRAVFFKHKSSFVIRTKIFSEKYSASQM